MTDAATTGPAVGPQEFTYFCNVTGRFQSYRDGDLVMLAWTGTMAERGEHPDVLERLFWLFNADGRPTAAICHSMSVGDVVVLDGIAYGCASMGWERLAGPPTNITTLSWGEAMKLERDR